MLWLITAISAYLILAIVFLVDKHLISGPVPNPKIYTFYVGILGALVLVIAPFIGFYIPDLSQIFLSFLAGALFIYALFWLYKALRIFEASRVALAVGALVPVFSLVFVYLFSKGEEILQFQELSALIFLILGAVLIVHKKTKISFKSFKFSAFSAFLLSLSFVLSKYVYLEQPFWNGFIWIRIGGLVFVLCFFLFSKEIKEEIFTQHHFFKKSLKQTNSTKSGTGLKKKEQPVFSTKKTAALFISNQILGGGAAILQNWAIFLAPLTYVALINALQGIQYLFLLIFTLIISLTWPFWAERIGIKEEISKKILLRKLLAILSIGIGLALLAFR